MKLDEATQNFELEVEEHRARMKRELAVLQLLRDETQVEPEVTGSMFFVFARFGRVQVQFYHDPKNPELYVSYRTPPEEWKKLPVPAPVPFGTVIRHLTVAETVRLIREAPPVTAEEGDPAGWFMI